ncbi:UNVERIFIED_CONTAM: hypothetical protein NY100_17060, partial [Prevotella sp. 15_C9]
MHVLLWLPRAVSDVKLAEQAQRAGLVVRPISPMYQAAPARSGLMLGFGGFSVEELRAAVVRLKNVLEVFVGAA